MPEERLKLLEKSEILGRIDLAGHAVVLAADDTAAKPYMVFHLYESNDLICQHNSYLTTLRNFALYTRAVMQTYEICTPQSWSFPHGEADMAGEYRILTGVTVNSITHVLGVSEKAEYPYLVSDCVPHPLLGFPTYPDAMGFDDYGEAVEYYCGRLIDGVEKSLEIQQERGIKDSLAFFDCIPDSRHGHYNGQIVVINADVLQRDKRTADHQLIYATGGNGCNPQARGQAVFGINVYDGKSMRYERADVLGVIAPDAVPAWAEPKIAEIENRCKERHNDQHTR